MRRVIEALRVDRFELDWVGGAGEDDRDGAAVEAGGGEEERRRGVVGVEVVDREGDRRGLDRMLNGSGKVREKEESEEDAEKEVEKGEKGAAGLSAAGGAGISRHLGVCPRSFGRKVRWRAREL